MWCTWTSLLLVSSALVWGAEVGAPAATDAPATLTTRTPPRTLDRQAAELVWNSWLKSPESSQNGPPRRITTKSLFITPLNCEKGQRLDRNECAQGVTVHKEEHERILLDKLNALFTSAPNDGIQYDYGDEEQGPLQLSIPIGLDPQAAPLQGQEPTGQAQELQPNYVKVDKKDENKADSAASVEAELELLKLQHSHNETTQLDNTGVLNLNVMTKPEKPKRDTPNANETAESDSSSSDEGQKELVYGHVNVDPVSYKIENQNPNPETTENVKSVESIPAVENNATITNDTKQDNNANPTHSDTNSHVLKKDGDQTKLNPENDYSDIGEAIKLISRYAEVTTDDNFSKDQNKFAAKDDSVLGTRTKLQHRRTKPQLYDSVGNSPVLAVKDPAMGNSYPKHEAYYRYPWSSQHFLAPPPDYPFRHLQDYWPGRNKIGGVYNTHENPRRHHHTYPHNFHTQSYPLVGYPAQKDAYPEQLKGYIRRLVQHHANPARPHTNNQDLYSLLGLRHWFSSEGTSKR